MVFIAKCKPNTLNHGKNVLSNAMHFIHTTNSSDCEPFLLKCQEFIVTNKKHLFPHLTDIDIFLIETKD